MFESFSDGTANVENALSEVAPSATEQTQAPSVEPVVEAVATPPTAENVVDEAGTSPVLDSEQGSLASIADSAPAVDPELESKPGFQNLRTQYQTLKAELESLKAVNVESQDSYLTLDAPVEDWDAGTHLDKLRDEVPPYYNKVAWTLIERHLPDVLPAFLQDEATLPPEMKELIDASAVAILQKYTGMEPEQIGEAIRQYRQQLGYSPVSGQQSPSIDITQLAYQNGLDPANPAHFGLLTQIAQQQRELSQLRSGMNELTAAEGVRMAQTSQAKVNEQVESFKTNLFAKIEVPTGYDYVKSEIVDRVTNAFERDPIVVKAKENLEKFYKQGTPDLRAAASEVNRLQTKLSSYFKEISEHRLNEVKEIERLKSQVSQNQQGVKNIPSGTGVSPTMAPNTVAGQQITPSNASSIAVERWRANKANRSA